MPFLAFLFLSLQNICNMDARYYFSKNRKSDNNCDIKRMLKFVEM